MHIPYWIKKCFTNAQVDEIQKTVVVAELKTQAELVPMVVRSSSVKHKEFKMAYIFSALAGLITVNPLFFVMIYIISLIQKKMIKQDVYQRAVQEFYSSSINQTKFKTGVLLMVSLEEKQVVILADEKINDFVDSKVWLEIVEQLIKEIKQNNLAKGLNNALSQIGKICSEVAPAVSNDINELSDKLIIKE